MPLSQQPPLKDEVLLSSPPSFLKIWLEVQSPSRKGRVYIMNLDVKFFPTQPEVGILARKIRLVMNWYRFLGQECSFFNAIISYLITLKALKSKK